jgi:hypothetical protein
MITKQIKELESAKAKVVQMEKAVMAERAAALKTLHLDMGFATRDELIAALRGSPAAGKRGRPKKAKAAAAPGRKSRRKRAKITPELRQNIIDAVKAGGTGNAVAKKFGVSLPTVQNIKKAAGLVAKKAGRPKAKAKDEAASN